MPGDKGINAGSNSPDSYEAAVLDFLDREMAALQPSEKKADSSEELDALVSDLLKQVLTESNQPAATQTTIYNEAENLLAEFPPAEEQVLYAGSKGSEAPAEVQSAPISQPIPLKTPEENAGRSSQSTEPTHESAEIPKSKASAPLFASAAKSTSSIPKIAIGLVCLLACIGLAIYLFLGSKKGDSDAAHSELSSQPAAVAPVVSKPSTTAIPISQIAPRYPDEAINTDAAATIVLDVQIDDHGKVVKATPLSGLPLFHKEAINAAMRWQYKPATVNGANVPSHDRVTMTFKP
jgi:TonB family protein